MLLCNITGLLLLPRCIKSNLYSILSHTICCLFSIVRLFQSQQPVKGNSTDVVLFVAYANDSTSLLVINGLTGEISWSFHKSTGLPVPPIPVLGVSDAQQAFVIWIPKSESMSLIPKHRISRQIQQDNDDYDFFLHDDNDSNFYESIDDEEEEDGDSDDDDGVTLNEFNIGLLQEILDADTNDSPLSQKQFVDTYNKGDKVLLSTKKEKVPVIKERGYNGDLVSFIRKQFSGTEEEVGPQEERSNEQADPEILSSKLEWDLSDLANRKINEASLINQKKDAALNSHHKKDVMSSSNQKKDRTSSNSHHKDETSVSNEKKDDALASIQKKNKMLFSNHGKDETAISIHKTTANAFAPRIQSIPKLPKEQHLEPIREEKKSDFQNASMHGMIQNSQFLTGNDKQENSKLGPFKKPSYHKRSVQTSPSGTQCVRSSDDDAESYVALLLLKDTEGKQQIVKITEEGPLYLGKDRIRIVTVRGGCGAGGLNFPLLLLLLFNSSSHFFSWHLPPFCTFATTGANHAILFHISLLLSLFFLILPPPPFIRLLSLFC